MRMTRRQWWQGAVALGATAAWGAIPATPRVQADSLPVSFVEAPGSPIQVPTYGGGIAIGDFNRDGTLDVAVYQDATLMVLLGNGDGTFRPAPGSPTTFPNGIGPLTVTDLNGDGVPDIVGAGTAPQYSVPVLLGNGDGTFRPAPALPIVDVYDDYPVAVHDYNNDGIPDVVYAGYQAGTSPVRFGIRVLLGNGDGTFRVGPFTATPLPYPEHVVGQGVFRRGDVLDVALAGGTVLRSNGDGTFTQIVATNTTSVGGAAADYNGDGLTDLAFTANPRANHIYVVTSNGDGTFTVAYEFPLSAINRVQAGDVNGDGRPDLVAVDPQIKEVHVYLNTSPNLASVIARQPAPHAMGVMAASTPAPAPTRHPPLPTPTPLPQPPPRTTTGSARGAGTGTATAATPLPAPLHH